MNLALTYASRTQHVRLARHISELIQMKSLEEFSDEDDDFENPIGQLDDDWTNQDADDDDVMYAKSRSHSLNKKSDLVSKSSGKKFSLSGKFGKASSSDGRSKFSHYMDQVKRGKFLSSASSGSGKTSRASKDNQYHEDEASSEKRREQDDENSLDANYDLDEGATDTMTRGYDETKELFSDTEQDAVGDTGDGGTDLGGEGERGTGAGSDDDGVVDDFSFTPTRDVGGYSSSSTTGKRANPFKVRQYMYMYNVQACINNNGTFPY